MLEGVVVLELSQVFAGPLAARLLAEQGATVIKIERPTGDVSRQLPWRVNGRSGYFVQQNRGKLGVSLDLRKEDATELLWRLVEKADVVIDGFGPGVLEKFGFTYSTMSSRNPKIIVCELSAVGRSGSLGASRGYDQVGACYSGVAYTAGDDNGGPSIMPSVALGDAGMGMCAYAGIVSALYEARDSGKGQLVDVAIVDAYIQSHSNNIEGHSLSGGQLVSRPVNGQNATVCPAGVFKASDGKEMYIVALSNEEWVRIANCIGHPEVAHDPDFSTNEARIANRSRVLALLNDWLATIPDRETAVQRLYEGGVPAAPVLDIGEVIDHPHLRERGTIEMINDERLGEFAVPGPPFRLSRTGRTPLAPAPELGEHNRYVFESLIGLSGEEIEQGEKAGALISSPDPAAS